MQASARAKAVSVYILRHRVCLPVYSDVHLSRESRFISMTPQALGGMDVWFGNCCYGERAPDRRENQK